MLTLIFDKGLSTQKQLMLNSFQERPVANILSGTYSMTVDKDHTPQRVTGFIKGGSFETVVATNSDGIELPINGSYNHIQDFSCTYNDASKQYSISITLSYAEVSSNAK